MVDGQSLGKASFFFGCVLVFGSHCSYIRVRVRPVFVCGKLILFLFLSCSWLCFCSCSVLVAR